MRHARYHLIGFLNKVLFHIVQWCDLRYHSQGSTLKEHIILFHYGLLKSSFQELLRIAIKDIFLFNKIFYKQTDGVAMGSPLIPNLSNILNLNIFYGLG